MDLNPAWEYVSDDVMGGVSHGQLHSEVFAGREATRLTGSVSLENNGGFLQMAFDVAREGLGDPAAYSGLTIDVFGNSETYEVRLRTDDLTRPWQSFRAAFLAKPSWQTIHLGFDAFTPNKTDHRFEPARLRRIGVLAVGRAFEADIAVARIGLV